MIDRRDGARSLADSPGKGAIPHRFRARWARAAQSPVWIIYLLGGVASAEIADVIQLYNNQTNPQGTWSAGLHVNTTPSGRQEPYYPGEVTNHHGVRFTPEISYGLTDSLEASVYLPVNIDRHGQWSAAGGIGRLTWIPLQAPEEGGWFLGGTVSAAGYDRRFQIDRWFLDGGFIAGYEDEDWLLTVNTLFSWSLTRDGVPDFFPALALMRHLDEMLSFGFEYYGETGPVNNTYSLEDQSHTIFSVIEYGHGDDWNISLGLGRGLTSASDEWTIKTIFFAPLDGF
ncbi:MAG: hypothetical protein PHE55_10320 [Methylococcaceae bacterium]|nr:hypothetical protein [Methylococcaceae bacterium]